MVRAEPHPALRSYVREYCAYEETTATPMSRRELPVEDCVLVLNLGEPLFMSAPAGTRERHSSFVAGLSRGPTVTETAGAQRGVQVDLTPLGARMFLGQPMDELAHRAVELDDVLGRTGGELEDRVASARTAADRFDILDRTIRDRVASASASPPAVWWAWRRLRETGGAIRVDSLAHALGISRRHLTESFRREVGIPPKLFARIVRFRAALASLDDPEGASVADVAATTGYYDQAHLDREFHDLAGLTPSEYRMQRLPDGGGLAEP